MKTYFADDFIVEVPPGYVDQTTNVLHLEREGKTHALVITRQPLGNVSFAEHAKRTLKELARAAKSFRLVRSGPRQLTSGTVAVEATLEAVVRDKPVVQRILIVPHQEVSVALVLASPRSLRHACDQMAEGITSTLRQRRE